MQALLGLILMIMAAWWFRERRPGQVFPWRVVLGGLGLQFFFAVLILKTDIGTPVFSAVNNVFVQLMEYSDTGARFLFGDLVNKPGQAGSWGAGGRMPEGSAQRGCAKTHLQDANFAKRCLANLLVLVRLLELLDCNDLPSLLVACLEDNAIRSARRKRKLSTAGLVRGGRGSARTPRRSCPAPRSSPFSPEALEDKACSFRGSSCCVLRLLSTNSQLF